MNMSWEQIVIFALSLGFSVLGWFARQMWEAVQQLRKDLSILELKVSTDYVRYDRLKDIMEPVLETLQRIEKRVYGG